jgi:GNAT superfamily N-acetyltransferase
MAAIEISTNPARLDLDVIHGFLAGAYWSRGIPRAVVERSLRHSLCFGAYAGAAPGGAHVGFARVVTDYATFALVSDVFVVESQRRRGIAKLLMRAILAHPELQGLRRWMLATHDAHGLYRQFGFTPVAHPEIHMEIHRPGLYLEAAAPETA